jgi:serine/threonine protein kinase
LDSDARHTELILSWHFTAPLGVSVARLLAQQLGSNGPCLRLLRLLSRECFDQSRYTNILPFARGAFGRIYRAKRLPAPGSSEPVQHVVIKSIEVTSSGFDASPLSAVFSEVSALERYALAPCPLTMLGGGGTGSVVLPAAANGARVGHPGVCQILDYGLTDSAYWVVLRRYNSSLSEWRHTQQPATALSPAAIAVYLSVLQQLAATMQALATDAVVHFDLKGANVLVEPLEGVRDSQLYGAPPPPPCQPLFRVVIADFGEAQSYSSTEKAYTVRSRYVPSCFCPGCGSRTCQLRW